MLSEAGLSLVLSLVSLLASVVGLLLAIFRRLHACSCCGVACLFKSSLKPGLPAIGSPEANISGVDDSPV